MADVASTLRLWSTTVGSNSPSGSTIIGAGLDDNLRQIQATVRQFLASQASNMASASTVDLSTADGYYIAISGTTPITALGTEGAGIHYLLKFLGALTFTYNATSLILPGAASITTAAGDVAMVVSEGSGNWRCVFYERASAEPLAPFVDTSPVVKGSGDATKKIRFEVDNLTTATTRVFTVPDADTKIGPSVLAVGRNISARTNSGTPNTKIDIAADEVLLKDTNGLPILASALSGTVDFGTVGANGIDAGSQVASTWYYGWAIAKPDGTTAVLGSTSNSAPALPTGYTYKALVTAARSNASTQFVRYRQFGRRAFYETQQSLGIFSSTSEQTVSGSATYLGAIPTTIAPSYALNVAHSTSGGGVSDNQVGTLRVVSGSDYFTSILRGDPAISNCAFPIDIPNTGSLFSQMNNNTSGATCQFSLWVSAFDLPGI